MSKEAASTPAEAAPKAPKPAIAKVAHARVETEERLPVWALTMGTAVVVFGVLYLIGRKLGVSKTVSAEIRDGNGSPSRNLSSVPTTDAQPRPGLPALNQ